MADKKIELTNEDLRGIVDPSTLSEKDYNRWVGIQKKENSAAEISLKQLENKVRYDELQARMYKAARDIQVNVVEMMEATIKNSRIFGDYARAKEINDKNNKEVYMKMKMQAEQIEEFANMNKNSGLAQDETASVNNPEDKSVS